ncbi:MAG: D-alanyl-D-alanine carboxypeptidase/D-alanyl-D-alanine-endopeptidase [bacterium]|nr:D-alanyl-D-alanine carboxypeptidase/D-alanyl-D-alanine-endopeptidase [bacterium]
MKLGRIVAPILALALVGGYVALDGADIVPGPLTTRPVISDPAPHPVPVVQPAAADPAPFAIESVTPADVTGILAEFVAQPEVGPRVAVDIRDASTGARIASHNPTQLGPPASSTKVLTAAATLARLGPAHTFSTTTVLADSTIVLVGGGDLLLGVGEPAEGADGRASLTVLAEQTATALKSRGITTISLGVDDTLFEGDGVDVWNHLDYRWVIRMTPLAVRGGMDGAEFVSDRDYTIYTAELFAGELATQGITVEGSPTRMAAPEGAALVGVVESATVEEVTAWMLKTSNNSVSEALARHVAIARGEGSTAAAAAAAVTAEIAALGLPATGLYLADTCGLASENLISPDLLVETVQLALSGANPRLDSMVEGFPISYLDGTLSDRIMAAAGEVRAKTGTLATVVSLTGLIEARSGARLTFSVVAAGLEPGGVWGARLRVDQLVAALTENA